MITRNLISWHPKTWSLVVLPIMIVWMFQNCAPTADPFGPDIAGLKALAQGGGQGYDGKLFSELKYCDPAHKIHKGKVLVLGDEAKVIRENCEDIEPRPIPREDWRLHEGDRPQLYYAGITYPEELTPDERARIVPDPFDPSDTGDTAPLVPASISNVFMTLLERIDSETVTQWFFQRLIRPNERMMTDNSGVCNREKVLDFGKALKARSWLRGLNQDQGNLLACDLRAGDVLPADVADYDGIILFNTASTSYLSTVYSFPANLKDNFVVMVDRYGPSSYVELDFQALSSQSLYIYDQSRDSGPTMMVIQANGIALTYDYSASEFGKSSSLIVNGTPRSTMMYFENLRSQHLPLDWTINSNSEEFSLPLESSMHFQR